MLYQYCSDFEAIYGRQHKTANLLAHLHAAECVRNLGPLWTSSCFPFENLNGLILKLVHGTQYAQLQITNTASLILNVPKLLYKLRDETDVSRFCHKMLHFGKRYNITEKIADVFVVGKIKSMEFIPLRVRVALTTLHLIVGKDVGTFDRLKKNGTLYTSKSYPRQNKHKGYCLKYKLNELWDCFLVSSSQSLCM